MKLNLTILLFIFSLFSSGQTIPDSLEVLINKENSDTAKSRVCLELSDEFYQTEPQLATALDSLNVNICNKALKGAKGKVKEVLSKQKALGLYNLGYTYDDLGEPEVALNYYQQCLEIQKQYGSQDEIANTINNIAYVYESQAKYIEALRKYQECLKIYEATNFKEGEGTVYNNIGSIYLSLEDFDEAERQFLKSKELREGIDFEEGVANSLVNLGFVYMGRNQFAKARQNFQKAEKISVKIEANYTLASALNNIGLSYLHQKNNDSALVFFKKSLYVSTALEDKDAITDLYTNIGNIYFLENNIDSAWYYSEKSYLLSKELGYPESIKNSARLISKIYAVEGNKSIAFDKLMESVEMQDSVRNKGNHGLIVRQTMAYQHEKDSLLLDEKHKSEQAKTALEKKATRNLAYGLAIAALLFVGLAIFLFKRNKEKQRTNEIITKQKEEVEFQKEVVEEKQKEILDSIKYALHIQQAILPTKKELDNLFEEYFVLYKPKDIVSGDFYWANEVNGKQYIAAIDCTGHGVPGAFMSLVGNDGLNRAMNELGITQPAEILNSLDSFVTKTLNQNRENSDVRDGMDMALIALDKDAMQLEYAGAMNPLLILRKGEWIEIKGNKQPIGSFIGEQKQKFTNHTIKLEKGDTIYIYSDGYIDQFGGEKGKKFKSSRFKKLLVELQNENLITQKEKLHHTLENWMQNYEQIDDVCVVGVRV